MLQYNKTIDAVYDVEDSVETLLDLLQMYREKAGDKVAEKGGSIFTKACFLLVILVQDEERALVGVVISQSFFSHINFIEISMLFNFLIV